jgi:cytochrome c biogenesis protein CcdA
VGMGLSSACLSCMGGAVLYPLLVFAGITSWYSGLITLTLYSLGIAVPMVFIALGFFRMQLSLTRRIEFNRVLRLASAAMLAGIGLLILSGNERILTDLTFRFLAEAATWSV